MVSKGVGRFLVIVEGGGWRGKRCVWALEGLRI